jgi:hypothetical protein
MDEEHKSQKSKRKTESSALFYVLIGMVCLLLVFSTVQTVQIMKFKEKVSTASSVTTVAAAAPAAQAPAPRPAAPTMVGGC